MEEMTLTETETTELDKLELVPFTDPKLREVPQDFDFEKEDAKELKDKLITAMRELGGVGLSANQVGIDRKCFVIGDEGDFTKVFFNMEIIGASKEEESLKEGCLSFPGLWLMVKRPKNCSIKYFNEEGEEIIETYQGVTARVILHEYDHMLGANFTMRVSKMKLERAFKALEKKVKKYQRQQANQSNL